MDTVLGIIETGCLFNHSFKTNCMIYSLPIEDYPDTFIEELKYKDENHFEWRIARVDTGFFVRLTKKIFYYAND